MSTQHRTDHPTQTTDPETAHHGDAGTLRDELARIEQTSTTRDEQATRDSTPSDGTLADLLASEFDDADDLGAPAAWLRVARAARRELQPASTADRLGAVDANLALVERRLMLERLDRVERKLDEHRNVHADFAEMVLGALWLGPLEYRPLELGERLQELAANWSVRGALRNALDADRYVGSGTDRRPRHIGEHHLENVRHAVEDAHRDLDDGVTNEDEILRYATRHRDRLAEQIELHPRPLANIDYTTRQPNLALKEADALIDGLRQRLDDVPGKGPGGVAHEENSVASPASDVAETVTLTHRQRLTIASWAALRTEVFQYGASRMPDDERLDEPTDAIRLLDQLELRRREPLSFPVDRLGDFRSWLTGEVAFITSGEQEFTEDGDAENALLLDVAAALGIPTHAPAGAA